MKAITTHPFKQNSLSIADIPEPILRPDSILCEMVAVGICGTDRELIAGEYGSSPPSSSYLVLGHECMGQVIETKDSRFKINEYIVPIVRRPDPTPCVACAAGEWDMCRNGLYTECGIFKRHGFAAERFVVEGDFAVPIPPGLEELGVLLEPCSIVAKAWEQCERIFHRSTFRPNRALVTGAGPVGLLASMILRQANLETHVLDRVHDGLKPELVKKIGAFYHYDFHQLRKEVPRFDVMIECTGAASLVVDLMSCIAPDGILCLTGVSSGGRKFGVDIGALNREIVLENEVIFGSVNANKRHYLQALSYLEKSDPQWLNKLITRRVPLSRGTEAYIRKPDDIKTILVPG